MRIIIRLALLAAAASTIFGCAHNYYSIPRETLEKQVQTIGIAPFFTDTGSDIRHPDKGSVVSLIQNQNLKNQKELIGLLRGTGSYYAVRQLDEDPVRLFSSLVAGRERRDDAGIVYNKYFYKKDEIKKLASAYGLDALMLVTVGGVTRQGKVYASNYLSYLETDFNFLAMTAQLLDKEGNVIWEYPNFRRSSLSYPMLFRLDYPDFDEAAANLSEKVNIKFKSLAGVGAAFAKSEASKVAKEQQVASLYAAQYEEIISLLEIYKPLFSLKKEHPVPASTPVLAPISAPMTDPAPASTSAAGAPAPADKAAPARLVPAASPVTTISPTPITAPLPAASSAPAAYPASIPPPPRTETPARTGEPRPVPTAGSRTAPAPLAEPTVTVEDPAPAPTPDGVPLADIIQDDPPAK